MRRFGTQISNSCLLAMVLTVVCGIAISLVCPPACAGGENAPIVVRGSKTLQPMVRDWADTFVQTAKTPPFDIIAIGTSDGVENFLMGRADIAMASRPMSQEEVTAARDKGMAVRETIVARMGIAVVINRDNTVSSVTVNELAEIFSGRVQSWQKVGGPDQLITVVRKTSGWSPDFFRRRIMGDRDFAADSLIVASKEDIVAEVASRTWSIGVTGMPEAIPALDRISLLRLASESSGEDATYALSRPLFFYTLEDSPSVQPFLEYVTGATAQEMIVDTGFYPAHQADAISTE